MRFGRFFFFFPPEDSAHLLWICAGKSEELGLDILGAVVVSQFFASSDLSIRIWDLTEFPSLFGVKKYKHCPI